MNYEENRLNTFTNWPTSAEVDPIRIAKAGFYYTGQGVEVQCFSCGAKISEWDYGDQVMARHRRLDPNCPFVVNPQSTGNVPLNLNQRCPAALDAWIPPSLNSIQDSDHDEDWIDMNVLQNQVDYGLTAMDQLYRNDPLRLLSFINWPVTVISREAMVSAGLYHAGEGRVRCAWCGGELDCVWRQGDDPVREHRLRHPGCLHARALELAQAVPTTPQDEVDSPDYSPLSPPTGDLECPQTTETAAHNARVLSGEVTWRALGVVAGAEGARHPQWAALGARLASYTDWPHDRAQTPDVLSEAGFFYTGQEDRVRCFYCDGGLGSWERSDSPWTEHAHWFPHCGYVLLVKGVEFVEQCKDRGIAVRADSGLTLRGINQVTFPVAESQIEEQMESPFALSALGAGLDAARVRRALMRRLRSTGQPFSSSEALIDAVLDDQLNEEAWSASPNNHSMARDIISRTFQNIAPCITLSPRAELSDQSDTAESRTVTPSPARAAAPSPRAPRVPPASVPEPGSYRPPARAAPPSPRAPPVPPHAPAPTPCSSRPTDNKGLSLEEENRQLKEARLCKVCMDSEVSVVFLPCGHLVTCAGCGASLAACPLCRGPVRALVRAYLA